MRRAVGLVRGGEPELVTENWLGDTASFGAKVPTVIFDPGGPPVSIELRAAASPAVIEISGGSARTRLGTAEAPDLVLQGEAQLILALFSGSLTVAEVADLGLEISGDTSVLQRVLPESGSGLDAFLASAQVR